MTNVNRIVLSCLYVESTLDRQNRPYDVMFLMSNEKLSVNLHAWVYSMMFVLSIILLNL